MKKKYKCRVCGKKFDNLLIHLHNDEEKLLKERPKAISLGKTDIKPDHLKLYNEIEDSINWINGSKLKCFCGGDIKCWSLYDNNYYSVEVSCDRCRFLWDED